MCNQTAQTEQRRIYLEEDKQSRRFQLTINNPAEKGLTHNEIKRILISDFKTFEYCCMADEKGSCYHTHVFICFNSRVRVSTIKKHFPSAHYEIVKGSIDDNISYIQKSGKWENDKKHGTQIPNTFEEVGTRPLKSKGRNSSMSELYQMILDGYTNAEILSVNQDYIMNIDKLDKVRMTLYKEKYGKQRRLNLKTTYIYGATGTGKTRDILDKYGDDKVYRVTDYRNPFDDYEGESIILFDEFRDSISLEKMLLYCDVYPAKLPSRYNNKFACYERIFIVSNWSLEDQYKNEQTYDKESWNAFLRRIHDVEVYRNKNTIIKYSSTEDYINRYNPFIIKI